MIQDNRYCYIKDIENTIKPSWENKHGVTVKTKNIREHKAMDHLDGPMEMYCTLPKRTYEYLKKENRWVSAEEIREKAINAGFNKGDVKRMCDEFLDHHAQVGSMYQGEKKDKYDTQEVPNHVGMIYHWWNMTPAELARNKQALEAFDAL